MSETTIGKGTPEQAPDTIRPTGQLVVEPHSDGLQVRRGDTTILVHLGEVRRLVNALVEEAVDLALERGTIIDLTDGIADCPACGAVFDTLEALQSHFAECQSMFRCEACGATFTDREGYRRHVFQHLYPEHQE